MTPKKALQIAEQWGDKFCDHPQVETVGHFSAEVCSQCGDIIRRDANGKPIPKMPSGDKQ